MTTDDDLVTLAKSAETRLIAAIDAEDFDAIDGGLKDAAEAARRFHADLARAEPITIERLLALEALLRAAGDVQPVLAEIEIDGLVKAHGEKTDPSTQALRAASLRDRGLAATRSLLEGLSLGFGRAFGSEVRS